jgi:prevent-host-death family protein
MTTVTLADAKARLSELIEKVAQGATIQITRRGKPVAQISPAQTPRKPIDVEMLRAATKGMTPQTISAGEFIRQMRDEGY